MAILPFIPATFIPISDLGRSNLSLELPPGTRLQDTVALAEQARAKLAGDPGTASTCTPPSAARSTSATRPRPASAKRARRRWCSTGAWPTTASAASRNSSATRARAWPTCPARASATSAPSRASCMQLVLASDDPHRLIEAALALERDLRTHAGPGQRHLVGLAAAPGTGDRARTRRAPPTWASPPPTSPKPRASPPPATTRSAWRS